MEFLIAIAVMILFDIAAWHWGIDSRVGLDDDRFVDRPSHRWI